MYSLIGIELTSPAQNVENMILYRSFYHEVGLLPEFPYPVDIDRG